MNVAKAALGYRGHDFLPACVVLEENGGQVYKALRFSRDASPSELAALVRVKLREAVRDFAYLEHGDAWREHVPKGIFFTGETTEEEKTLITQILEEIAR